VSTLRVERQNLNVRMSMRRFTRADECVLKKDRRAHSRAVALFEFYNFCRIHKSLRVTLQWPLAYSDTVRDMEWIVGLIDAREARRRSAGRIRNEPQ
jgi:hypothetical protein